MAAPEAALSPLPGEAATVAAPRREAASSRHAGEHAVPAWLPLALRVAALSLATAHAAAAAHRQAMNEDGINYLDIGSAFARGEWHGAINPIWSPLYAWLLGTAVEVVEPSIWWEIPLVHLINLCIFAAALVCFDFFWRELTARYYDACGETPPPARFPPGVFLAIGYSLFIWSSLNLIAIWAVTPDMLVAAAVYLAGGLLLRMSAADSPRWAPALFGVVLAVGYLAKAALFPLGLVGIALASTMKASSFSRLQRLVWGLALFAIVAGPFLLAISARAGRFTFGDVGRFTYMKHVNELPYPHGDRSNGLVAGAALHAPRRLDTGPAVFEFAEPIGGTYPLAFNPGYWTEGLSPRVDAGRQLRALASNARFYFDFFFREQGAAVGVALILGILVLQTRGRPRSFSPEATLVAWAVCALGLYAVVYVTPRYVAPFVVMLWAGVLSSVRLPDSAGYRRVTAVGGVALAAFVWINIAAFNLEGAAALLGMPAGAPAHASVPGGAGRLSDGSTDRHPEIAQRLLQSGVRPGDRVAFIGESFTAFWARLARVRIVAEIPLQHAAEFWEADAEAQSAVMTAFGGAGAVAAVARTTHEGTLPAGWKELGDTGYAVRLFR